MYSYVNYQEEDNICDRKIYGTCDISDGKPCDPCAEYLELEARIEETRRALEEQLEQRRKIREKINRVHDPILVRVPGEITAYIFELAASVDLPPDGFTPLLEGELYEPLTLGNVCGAWRDIAWGMPQLWTFMFARISTVKDLPLRLNFATDWLSRSGECLPLSIHFHIDDVEDEDGELIWEEFIPFIELLNDYSSRWKDLCGVARFQILEKLYAEHQGAPMLQHLRLSATRRHVGMKFNLGCKSLPQPRSVQIYNVFAPDFHIDWGCVTQLQTNTLLVETFLDELPQLRSLKELSISGVDGRLNPQSRLVTHLTLESLYIEDWDQVIFPRREFMHTLLRSLILPSLRHLKLNLQYNGDMLTAAVTLVQQLSCSLSWLSLSRCPANSQDLCICLLDCANLIEELEFEAPEDNSIFTALQDHIRHHNHPGSQGLSLPNLQHLSLIADNPNDVPWNALLPIFDQSYQANQRQWKTFSIYPGHLMSSELQDVVNKDLSHEILQGLLKLVESGIELFSPKKITKDNLLNVMRAKDYDSTQYED